jgi:four helix bundle protein
MATTSFTQLQVWQAAHQATLTIYQVTRDFPSDERYGLAHQMRKCGVSIPANIAEGFGRRAARDKAHFYTIAAGSTEELKYYVILSRDLRYIETPVKLASMLEEVSKMLCRLIERTLERLAPRGVGEPLPPSGF